jgi:hypothetical protein
LGDNPGQFHNRVDGHLNAPDLFGEYTQDSQQNRNPQTAGFPRPLLDCNGPICRLKDLVHQFLSATGAAVLGVNATVDMQCDVAYSEANIMRAINGSILAKVPAPVNISVLANGFKSGLVAPFLYAAG